MPRISRFYEIVVEKCSFQFLLYYIKMGLGPGNLKKIKSTSCAEFIDLCLKIFSCFRLKCTPFVLGKPVCHMALGWPHYYIHYWWGGGQAPLLQYKRDDADHHPHQLQHETHWLWENQHPPLKLMPLCLISVWVKRFSIQCLCALYPSWWPWTMEWMDI